MRFEAKAEQEVSPLAGVSAEWRRASKGVRVTRSSCGRVVSMGICWLLLVVAMPQVLASETEAGSQQARIDYLLETIAALEGAVFIRNEAEHSPQDAAHHLAQKLARAQSSFFAPPASSWTAEMFIDKLASESSLSGRPYHIRFSDGQLVDSGPWLHQQLLKFPLPMQEKHHDH